jgi:hypothetical protein
VLGPDAETQNQSIVLNFVALLQTLPHAVKNLIVRFRVFNLLVQAL